MFFKHEEINEFKTNETTNKASNKGKDDQLPLKTPKKCVIDEKEIQELECGIDVEESKPNETGIK